MRIVMKFGGTSVGTPEAIRQVVAIAAANRQRHECAIVVSAMNAPDLRTTDTLLRLAQAAADENPALAEELLPRLQALYTQAARELAVPDEHDALADEFAALFAEIHMLTRSIAVLGELSPRALDRISGQGERANARLIAAALRGAGLDALAIDATELIVTNDDYGQALPLLDETRARTQKRIVPLLRQGTIPVITGFIAATRSGNTTTLGRGGSDYSCALLGAALDAAEVWFWKEVDGVLSANPKIVPDALTLPRLSYIEMAELSYYGANVLHPRTVYPLVRRGIPIRIRNTFNPSHAGTLITGDEADGTVKAVTAIHNVCLITVGGPGMLGLTGVAARIFSAVARAGANTLLITQASSEQNICLAVPQPDATAAVAELRHNLAHDLSQDDIQHVDVLEPVVIVAVVGSGMRGTPGIAGQVFRALGQERINIIAIAQGSTEYNISFVVAAADGDTAVQVVHRAFAATQ